MENTTRQKLVRIQSDLKVGKGKFNKFGNYYYRSLEDVLDALKPLLMREDLTLTINDEINSIAEYSYIEAVVRLESTQNNSDFIETRAFAGIDKTKGKMDLSQIFGSASSYARKYAMNGMFLIDDSQDADSDAHTKLRATEKKTPKKEVPAVDYVKIKEIRSLIYKTVSIEELTRLKADNKSILKELKQDFITQYDKLQL